MNIIFSNVTSKTKRFILIEKGNKSFHIKPLKLNRELTFEILGGGEKEKVDLLELAYQNRLWLHGKNNYIQGFFI